MLRRVIAGLLLALGLSACSGLPEHYARPMPVERFVNQTPERQRAEIERVRNITQTANEYQEVLLRSGQPIRVGDSRYGFTMQCNLRARVVQIAIEGNPDGWNLATTAGTFMTVADEDCNPVFNRLADGRLAPIPLLANVANQEGSERVVFRGITNVFASLANGAGAAATSAVLCTACGRAPAAVIQNYNANANRNDAGALAGTNVGLDVGVGVNTTSLRGH